MDRIRQLLGRITELSDQELHELRDTILTEFDAMGSDPSNVMGVDEAETLEALAAAAETVRGEVGRREDAVMRAHDASRVLASFRTEPIKVAARVPDDRLPILGRVTHGRARALTASGMERATATTSARSSWPACAPTRAREAHTVTSSWWRR